jgi:hypothetical protein
MNEWKLYEEHKSVFLCIPHKAVMDTRTLYRTGSVKPGRYSGVTQQDEIDSSKTAVSKLLLSCISFLFV